ncbi:hypothetical protein ANANG_G00186330 [Anguilla anguilla]|uniref:SH2 domain-containing protein n=1 Tax=Anguilla anguilla TaxID=7936 RepID=A0A9D3M1J7_ANGAN|nr:hypothetical protein ANANG_G00186330 [Anguilla anguilla]
MDGDGDTYEAPPCERPAVKVPARRVEENVYLERSSAPEPCRQAPPPRPAKNMPTGKAPKLRHDLEETYIDPNAKKPPQVNREQKPGKKPVSRKTPPPRPGSAPAPSPAPSPAPPPASKMMSIWTQTKDRKGAMMTSIWSPMQLALPLLGLSALSATAESQLQAEEWFAGNCDRKTAEVVLSRVNKDGAFLVRYSSAQNTRQPYTLVVFFRQKVYNIPIRYLEHTQGYALGKEGKKSEEFFSNLQEIISHHRNKPIQLIDSKSQAKHTTYLTHPARP